MSWTESKLYDQKEKKKNFIALLKPTFILSFITEPIKRSFFFIPARSAEDPLLWSGHLQLNIANIKNLGSDLAPR